MTPSRPDPAISDPARPALAHPEPATSDPAISDQTGPDRTGPIPTGLDALLAREAIRDCLALYARGIDRADLAALTASYWPDAQDSHGAYSGPISGFIERVRRAWQAGPRNIHHLTNILIAFRDDRHAAVETYFLALQRSAGPDGVLRQVQLSGRYCDLFQRRGAEWRVLRRTVVYDWVAPEALPEGSEAQRFGPRTPIGAPWPDDPVYRIGPGAG